MPSLLEQQRRFGAALTSGSDAALLDRLAGPAERNRQRFAAYRRNFVGNGRMALASTFPVLRALLGDRFDGLADDYLAGHHSRDADLNRLGDRFASHLAAHQQAEDWPWLRAMAELEWALQETYDAPGALPADLSALAGLPPELQGRAVLLIWAGAREMTTEQPVLAIWAAHQLTDPEARDRRLGELDLRPSAQCLMTTRQMNGECGLVALSPGETVFYRTCRSGQPLAEGLAEALAAEPGFAVGEVLASGLGRGWIVGWRLADTVDEGD